jgi:hypothetical protein
VLATSREQEPIRHARERDGTISGYLFRGRLESRRATGSKARDGAFRIGKSIGFMESPFLTSRSRRVRSTTKHASGARVRHRACTYANIFGKRTRISTINTGAHRAAAIDSRPCPGSARVRVSVSSAPNNLRPRRKRHRGWSSRCSRDCQSSLYPYVTVRVLS